MRTFLKKVHLFADLSEADFDALCAEAREIRLKSGETLFLEGDYGDKAYVIQLGELEIIKHTGSREVLLDVRKPGDVIGEMALLEEAPRMATVRARGPVSLLTVQRDTLNQLLENSPSASRAMLQTILSRLRNTQAQLRQSEKMAQLGTLTAGIAHELNNPAAAIVRGSAQVRKTLAPFARAQTALSRHNFSPEQQALVAELTADSERDLAAEGTAGGLAQSTLESALEDWLDNARIRDPWDLAPTLAECHFPVERLAALREKFSPEELGDVLHWFTASYQAQSLIREINQGAARISDIVKALKSYAYLDQAPVQTVDIHTSLNNTLIILRHRLRSDIEVERDFDPNLPPIQAYGSELNQVWTNLIDNAIDALDGSGRVTIRTRQANDWVLVEVEDNGPGIPDAIRSRIFDAFFTTKPPGHGTGLGLNISYNIVVYKHHGDIRVISQPGCTRFQVWLPLDFQNPATSPIS